ncbi:MAG: GTPase Era [Bacteroidales bacterium]|jgi:GTP-binding protein Era|nr:GTPase Era [Bacteroidales bacterium]
MPHKSGFVNIIGNPNVGKSTIMNQMVGEKLSIITPKAQTTRHRILGIVNNEEYQIIYSDTPGILKPSYKLQEKMMRFVGSAFEDADIILYVTDVVEKLDKNQQYIDKLLQTNVPVLLLLNKIDLSNQEELEALVDKWKKILPQAEIFPVSATKAFNLDQVFKRIIELLPEGPPYYPKDALTDKTERFFVSEIIREKILYNYRKEIPYSVEIEVEEFKETEKLLRIAAAINVVRPSQKGILIGHKGQALKKTGTDARLELEQFFGKKVFLELFVKVSKDWRDKERNLNDFGYNN